MKAQQSRRRRPMKKTPANAQASEDVDDVDEDFSASSALESSESEVEAITNEEVQLLLFFFKLCLIHSNIDD